MMRHFESLAPQKPNLGQIFKLFDPCKN